MTLTLGVYVFALFKDLFLCEMLENKKAGFIFASFFLVYFLIFILSELVFSL